MMDNYNIIYALKFKLSKDYTYYKLFSLRRAKYKFETKKCFKLFVERAENSLTVTPNKFCYFVHKIRSHISVPKTIYSREQETIHLFTKHFSSVYSFLLIVDSDLMTLNIIFFDLPNNCYFS